MSTSLFDLSGRLALVTGSARGIGNTLARGLAAAGAKLVIHDVVEDSAVATAEALRGEGIDCAVSGFDVRDPKAVEDGVARIEREVGPIDILVNNAGIQRRKPVLEVDYKTWQDVLDVNLTGVFLVAQAVARHMVTRERGKIVNIASLQSALGRATITPYAAAKGGVLMLTRNLCVELAARNIQVNAIGPGYMRTEMTQALVSDEAFTAWLAKRTPAGRWGDPAELVGTTVFLASAASDFVNGQIVYVDGGILAAL